MQIFNLRFFRLFYEKLRNFTFMCSFRNFLQKKYVYTFSDYYLQYKKILKEIYNIVKSNRNPCKKIKNNGNCTFTKNVL